MNGMGESGSGINDQDMRSPAISRTEFEALAEMIGADMPEILVDLLETYLEESTEIVRAIVIHHREKDDAKMLRPVHSLKSSSASVGAMNLSQLCANLEAHLRDASDSININVDAYVDQIQLEYGRVEKALGAEMERLQNT